jgi:hypothetical protein
MMVVMVEWNLRMPSHRGSEILRADIETYGNPNNGSERLTQPEPNIYLCSIL